MRIDEITMKTSETAINIDEMTTNNNQTANKKQAGKERKNQVHSDTIHLPINIANHTQNHQIAREKQTANCVW